MNTTLHIQPAVWNHAMAYANSRGEQLTTIVERLLMSLSIPQKEEQEESHYYVSPKLKGFVAPILPKQEGLMGLRGIVKDEMTDKEAIGQYLYAKYGI